MKRKRKNKKVEENKGTSMNYHKGIYPNLNAFYKEMCKNYNNFNLEQLQILLLLDPLQNL